jgi:DNA polymerase-1
MANKISKNLLLIDTHSLIHRCYHALPPLTNKDGAPVGALYGVAGVLLRIVTQRQIDYVAALFDRPEPTFRKEKFADYKIHRPKAPDDLVSQIIEARNLVREFSIAGFEKAGFEGDDLIGTLAKKFRGTPGLLITILTGDLDSLQLVEDHTVVVETFRKGISDTFVYDEEGVRGRYGIEPAQVVDYKALVGDASDNIPGVAGIGPKTAASLLQKYKTLENFLSQADVEKPYEKVLVNREIALLSQELARIHCDVPVEASLEDLAFSLDKDRARQYMEHNGFSSLLKRLDGPQAARPEKLSHRRETAQQSLFSSYDLQTPPAPIDGAAQEENGKVPDDAVLLDPQSRDFSLYDSPSLKIGFDLKPLQRLHPIRPPYFDVMLGFQILGFEGSSWENFSSLIFKQELRFEDFLKKSYAWLEPRIAKSTARSVYYDIELPLMPVLADMESAGICVERKRVTQLSAALTEEIDALRGKLEEQFGKDTNLNSPKQLLEVFTKRYGARIKSTSAKSLEKIRASVPAVETLLRYRELFKLRSTYVDALEPLVARDGRVHPTFLQLGAATGRLSCQNPNLQNIPQESSWSRDIRNMFVACDGYTLVSFDYSQIELRVLASLTGDANMVSAFMEGRDIHTLTASKIFSVPPEQVDRAMRRVAKTLNFGMVYGMGYRALAQQSGLPSDKAKEFIEKYFEEFSSIKQWQAQVLEEARRAGVVINADGRFRQAADLHSLNRLAAAEAERAAINMPVQSLAADILKKAMLATHGYITKEHSDGSVRILLTIHDELMFEIGDGLLSEGKQSPVIGKLKGLMESAYELKVPLKSDIKMGKRWGEME